MPVLIGVMGVIVILELARFEGVLRWSGSRDSREKECSLEEALCDGHDRCRLPRIDAFTVDQSQLRRWVRECL